MSSIFDQTLESVFSQVKQSFDKFSCNSYPIKEKVVANIFLNFFSAKQSRQSGSYEQFLDFVTYALLNARKSYSSTAVDLWVGYLMGDRRNGVFVEIGAGDGIDESVSALLEAQYDWTGLLIEPNPALHDNINKSRCAKLAPYAIFNCENATMDFIVVAPWCNSFLYEPGKEEVFADTKDIEVDDAYILTVFPKTYDQIIRENNVKNVEFLSIAVNGFEFDILKTIDFANFRIPLVRVEHRYEAQHTSIFSYMVDIGYEPWLPEFTLENYFFVNRQFLEESQIRLDGEKDDLSHTHGSFESRAKFHVNERGTRSGRVDIVSVHFPKTGGTSLEVGLKLKYGEMYLNDVANAPGTMSVLGGRPLTVGAKIQAIHGHFRGDRYLNLRPKYLFTFIRDPIDRLISLYFHWKRHGPVSTEQIAFMKTNPSFEEFSNYIGPEYYAYFGGMDLGVFDFIGRFENYEYDLQSLGMAIGISFPNVHLNTGLHSQERQELLTDRNQLEKVRNSLSKDYQIYEKMLARSLTNA